MSTIVQDRKRKRVASKPALNSKKLRRAAAYHSSSSEDEAEPLRNKETAKKVAFVTSNHADSDEADEGGVELPNLEDQTAPPKKNGVKIVREEDDANEASLGSDIDDEEGDEEDEDEDEDTESGEDSQEEASNADVSNAPRKKSKRHDPDVFANSIQRILSSKLTSSKRADPVLSRSTAAQGAAKTLTDQKLDKAARRKLRADKRAEREKGHERDILGLGREDVSTGEVVELERMLKRTAQRGVVKLFNAVRAAQVGGLQAEHDAQGDHGKVIGLDSRKKKVDEMSKQGFLDLLASGKAAGP